MQIYANDLHKIDNTDRLHTLFWSIPEELHKNASRFQMTTAAENTSVKKRQELLEAIREDGTTLSCLFISPH